MGFISGLRSVLSFLTILPAGSGTIDDLGRYAFLFPIAGAIIGTIGGGAAIVLFSLLDQSLAGWLTLFILLLLSGFNHIDGVLDLGDALMIRGSRERRLEMLHDKHHGIGGHVSLFFVLVLTGSLLALLGSSAFVAILLSETLGKSAMIIAGSLGKPCPKGIGGLFIIRMKERLLTNLVLGVGISIAIAFALCRPAFAWIPISISVFFPALWALYLQRTFGCMTGDMLGCTSELTRLLVLSVFYAIPGGALLWGSQV